MAAPRIIGFNYKGFYAYSLTICCFEKKPFFSDKETAAQCINELKRATHMFDFKLLCYIFMPDHVHTCIEGKRPDWRYQIYS
ncbi:MAG: transposase [Deltaproteobacteria bacterium]|nr:transposase [Deltaproteobacteria bacterium]